MTVHARRGYNKATIAVANKLGRLVWAVWHKDAPCALPDAALPGATPPREMLSE